MRVHASLVSWLAVLSPLESLGLGAPVGRETATRVCPGLDLLQGENGQRGRQSYLKLRSFPSTAV